MKDSILNSMVIAAAFAALLISALGDLGTAPQAVVAVAPRVIETGKTIVTAKRPASDVVLVASIHR